NHETLGDFENLHFKPIVEPMMLYGEPRLLSVQDRLALTVWAYKTLILVGYDVHPSPFHSIVERKHFIKTFEPPERNLEVWVFKYRGEAGRMEGHARANYLVPVSGSKNFHTLKGTRHLILTFVVGHFGFQIRHMRGVTPALFDAFRPTLFWANNTVRIWPIDE